MKYIICIYSDDSDSAGVVFTKSGITLDEVFDKLKINNFSPVTFNDGSSIEFSACIDYKDDYIDEKFFYHVCNDWLDYDCKKHTDYYLFDDKGLK